jgi:site-specific recombinase XerD
MAMESDPNDLSQIPVEEAPDDALAPFGFNTDECKTPMARRRPQTLEDVVALVTDSVQAENTKRVYERALRDFFTWCKSHGNAPFDKALVQKYLAHLKRQDSGISTRNQALTVLRKLAEEARDNGLLSADIAVGIDRIKAAKRLGQGTGQWLTLPQARALITAPDTTTLAGKRDRVMLGLLMECGLRREEAATVNIGQIQQREGRTVITDLVGKGGRKRTVPVPERCAQRIEEWINAAELKRGRLLRPVNKADRLESGSGVSAAAIYKRIREYAESLGLEITPHDLRRTFGKLTFSKGRARLDQIQLALGHTSVRTTELYLNTALDLDNAACDTIDMEGK